LNGRVAWSEHFDESVGDPTWSADGNRIAFTVGRELYVTAGDGTGARGLRPTSGPLGFAAWRPGAGHELAVVDAPGRVSLIDTDTGRDLAHVPVGPDPLSLTWSSDGRRLLVATRLTLRVYDAGTRLVSRVRTPRGTSLDAAELSPSGRQIAFVVDERGGRQEAELASVGQPRGSRALLVGAGLGGLLFSPDGRWLLVAWNELDSWMFFTTSTPTRVRQISHVTAHFGTGEPVATAWCCTPRPSTAPTG
jgi:DNA-binding beta-propeller fold protein YncE